MGALGHYLETEGVPTTQISLIREHTEIIRPPRALWVPFELGRPFGAPGNPAFQREVLLAALRLLESSEGPVLEDFPKEAPESGPDADQNLTGWACPVNFASPPGADTDGGRTLSAFLREVADLKPWYGMSLAKRGRTTVGYFEPSSAVDLLGGFAFEGMSGSPRREFPLPVALRLAAQDLKAFYFEAVTARPGSTAPGSAEFDDWFFRETVAGQVFHAVNKRCSLEGDEALRRTGAMLLIPLGRV